MQVKLQGHGMIVSKRLSDHVNEHVARIERMLPGIEEMRVEFKRNSSKITPPRTVQITVRRKSTVLRAEEQHTDPLKAFDVALEALFQRIERFKGRRILNKRGAGAEAEDLLADLAMSETEAAEWAQTAEPARLLRIKTFSVVPMSAEEAIEQMELLGHTFFAFMSDEDRCVKVVYRRKAGDYGLLQPEK